MLRNAGFGYDPGDHWVTCDQGHTHWGQNGAAGMLLRHQDPHTGIARYFLQQRGPDVQHPGTWSTPGGAIEDGETPHAAAMREASEELGDFPAYNLNHMHTLDHGGWAYHTVTADVPHPFYPHGQNWDPYETGDAGWFTPHEIDELPLHPGFREGWDQYKPNQRPDPHREIWSRLGSPGFAHWLHWEPGSHGRGFVFPPGEEVPPGVHTWSVDMDSETPTHADYLDHLGYEDAYNLQYDAAHPFLIHPDGKAEFYQYHSNPAAQVEMADPRLTVHREDSLYGHGWNLAHRASSADTDHWDDDWDDEEEESPAFSEFYHIAPTQERTRIQQHGLQPSRPFNNPFWGEHETIRQQPEGIYGYGWNRENWGEPTHEDITYNAWDDAQEHPEKYDIWKIPHYFGPSVSDPRGGEGAHALTPQEPIYPELWHRGPETFGWPEKTRVAAQLHYFGITPTGGLRYVVDDSGENSPPEVIQHVMNSLQPATEKMSWWRWVNPERLPNPVEQQQGPSDETHPLAGGPNWYWEDEDNDLMWQRPVAEPAQWQHAAGQFVPELPEQDGSTEPQEVANPEDHWPDWGERPPDLPSGTHTDYDWALTRV